MWLLKLTTLIVTVLVLSFPYRCAVQILRSSRDNVKTAQNERAYERYLEVWQSDELPKSRARQQQRTSRTSHHKTLTSFMSKRLDLTGKGTDTKTSVVSRVTFVAFGDAMFEDLLYLESSLSSAM